MERCPLWDKANIAEATKTWFDFKMRVEFNYLQSEFAKPEKIISQWKTYKVL